MRTHESCLPLLPCFRFLSTVSTATLILLGSTPEDTPVDTFWMFSIFRLSTVLEALSLLTSAHPEDTEDTFGTFWKCMRPLLFNDLRCFSEIPKDHPDSVQAFPRLINDIVEIRRDFTSPTIFVLRADCLGCRKDCIDKVADAQLCPGHHSQTLWSFSSFKITFLK